MSAASQSSSSSTTERNLNEEFAHLLVEQFKPYDFGVYLFQDLEQDPSTEADIRKLLKKLSGQKIPQSSVPFMIVFEPHFDQICQLVAKIHKFVDLI